METNEEHDIILGEIVEDMHCWPQHQETTLHRVDLLAVRPNHSGMLSQAVVLLHSTDSQKGTRWTLIRLHKRQLPYFKRKIWFYLIIPDGTISPYEDYRDEPSAAEIEEFIQEYPGSTFAANIPWAKAQRAEE